MAKPQSLLPASDDFPLEPVPKSRELHWFALTTMRFGQFATLAQLLMGASLGYGMGLIPAFLALAAGTAILLAVAIPMGIVGQETGLATTFLTRWTGLGRWGSGLFSLVIGVSVMGWFGVQNALFAQGIHQLAGSGPLWIWTLVSGLAVTALVYGGILSMGWVAYFTVPLFLVLLAVGFGHILSHPVAGIALWHAPGIHAIPFQAAITVVVGSFITGAAVSPDMTRFHRNRKDVVAQTIATFVLGNALIAGLGVFGAQLLRSSNLTTAIALGGVWGWFLFVSSTIKVSDWDIYGAALALVNGIDLLGIRRISRRNMTLVVGVGGTLLAMAGIVNAFLPFLLFIGVATPPVAAIILVDYFMGRRSRALLVSRETLSSSARPGRLNAGALLAWGGGFAAGQWLPVGIGAINSLVAALVIYGFSIYVTRPGGQMAGAEE
ncbi:MAG: cytosine permease [Thermaerobacter sp.]|nr:cytosine permease [Thermaerobacter sp.]